MTEAKPKLPELRKPDFAAPTLYEYTVDQVRAIQAEAWNAAIEWAANECAKEEALAREAKNWQAVFAAMECQDAIRRAAVPTTGDNR